MTGPVEHAHTGAPPGPAAGVDPAAPDADDAPPPRPHVSAAEIGRVARRPGYLVGHLVVVAVFVTMLELGRWQWHVAHVKNGAVQNYAYAFQWWIFCGFGVVMWLRIMRDAVARAKGELPAVPDERERRAAARATAASAPTGYRAYVMPQSSELRARTPAGNALLEDYNDYLARVGAQQAAARNVTAPPPEGPR